MRGREVFALLFVGLILVLAVACGGTSMAAPSQAPPPPPPAPALVWHVVDTSNGGLTTSTACTPWGDRLYATTGPYYAPGPSIAVVPAAQNPCGTGSVADPIVEGPGSR